MTAKNTLSNVYDVERLSNDITNLIERQCDIKGKILLYILDGEKIHRISNFSEDDIENFKFIIGD